MNYTINNINGRGYGTSKIFRLSDDEIDVSLGQTNSGDENHDVAIISDSTAMITLIGGQLMADEISAAKTTADVRKILWREVINHFAINPLELEHFLILFSQKYLVIGRTQMAAEIRALLQVRE